MQPMLLPTSVHILQYVYGSVFLSPMPIYPHSRHILQYVYRRVTLSPISHIPTSVHILQYVYGCVVLSCMIPITIPVTYCNMCQERDRAMSRRERGSDGSRQTISSSL